MSYDQEGFPTRPNLFRSERHDQEDKLIRCLAHDEQDEAIAILTQMNKKGWGGTQRYQCHRFT